MGRMPGVSELADLIGDLIGVPAPDPENNFVEIGGDSLAAMQLAIVAEERWGVEIDVSEVIFAATVREIHEGMARSVKGESSGQAATAAG